MPSEVQSARQGVLNASRLVAGVGLLLSGWLGLLRAEAGQPPSLGEVRTFSQFWQLTREEALKGRPVRFEGVVVCYDAGWGQLYVHDGTETKYFKPQIHPAPLESGSRVKITGATGFAAGYPVLTNLHLVVEGSGDLPPAAPLELRDLAKQLGQWIEITVGYEWRKPARDDWAWS